jgi:ABC-type branched-subunit amino acid transport system ATPase component
MRSEGVDKWVNAICGKCTSWITLETGRLVAEGNPETLWNNDEIRAAYLGGRKAGY